MVVLEWEMNISSRESSMDKFKDGLGLGIVINLHLLDQSPFERVVGSESGTTG